MAVVLERLRRGLSSRYCVERVLGRGGMATVFLAQEERHGRRVAIKVLDPEIATQVGSARFLREIEIAAQLSHPHILPLFDSGEADGLLYFVMPYVEGESLRVRLSRVKQFPVEEAVHIASEVADALSCAHQHGVVHRDIKPENILLESGHAVVADFGIARAIAGADAKTSTGVAVGTPYYMSPEQALGGAADVRSDVYSLGCVMYEMLAGLPPFNGPSASSVVYQHLNAPVPRISAARPGVPPGIERAISKAMAKVPAERFATSADFAAALETPARQPAGTTRSGGHLWRRAAVGVIALGALLVTVGAWRGGWLSGQSPQPAAVKKDWILVADFDGPLGDTLVASAAKSLLSAAIDQSRIVATVPPEQIRQALAAAGLPRNTRVDAELARELAFRRAVRAVLEGSIGRLGKGYSVVVRVMDADTPRVLFTSTATARGDDDLIPELDELGKRLRRGLGEHRDALQATRSMSLLATPSFEAYRIYIRTLETYRAHSSNRQALRGYRAALAVDPEFASAWYAMSFPYLNLGYDDSARMCYREALRRRDRLTPAQLQMVEIGTAILDGDDVRAVAGYDLLLADNPGNAAALSNSAEGLWRLGRFEEALARVRRAIRLGPFGPTDAMRVNEAWSLMLLGRWDEGREACRIQKGIWGLPIRAVIEVAAGRFATAESLATHVPKATLLLLDLPDGLLSHRALARFGRGALGDADLALTTGLEACRAAGHGPGEEWYRRRRLELSVVSQGGVPPAFEGSGADTTAAALLTQGIRAAMANDPDIARRCLARAERRPGLERARTRLARALLRGRLESLAGRPQEAVRLLRPAVDRHLEGQGVSQTWLHWWLADAFEQANQPDSAIHYLRRIETMAFTNLDGAERPHVHLRLARLCARRGDLAEAARCLAAAERSLDQPDASVLRSLEETRGALLAARGMKRPEPS